MQLLLLEDEVIFLQEDQLSRYKKPKKWRTENCYPH